MNNIFCKHCGAKLDEDAKFCPSCGKPVETAANNVIKCEDCGREFPSGNGACPYCGCPVNTPLVLTPTKQSKIDHDKKKKPSSRNTAIMIALLTVLTALILVGGYFCFSYLKTQQQIKEKFSNAVSFYNSGDYSEALQICESFDDNPDAEDLANKCRYQLGMAAFTEKSWSEAKESFLSISVDNYGNTQELIPQCEEEIDKENKEREETEKRAQCADDKFLKDLETVVKSLLQTNMMIPDEALAINNSLILDKYKTSVFYDNYLKTAAYNLMDYFNEQKRTVQDTSFSGIQFERQIEWCNTNSSIATILANLYKKFEFMKDSPSFVRTFATNQYPFSQTAGTLRTISNNILDSLVENVEWHDNGDGGSYMLIHNKTKNTISVKFYYTDYVAGTKQYLGSSTYIAESIPPNSDYFIYHYDSNYNFSYDTTIHTNWEVLSIE